MEDQDLFFLSLVFNLNVLKGRQEANEENLPMPPTVTYLPE
jgi:hypothetical protein